MASLHINSNFTPAFDINSRTITIRKQVKSNPNYKPSKKDIPSWNILERAFIFLIETRVRHCEEQLAKATANDETWIEEENYAHMIFFPKGCFNIPVYEAMIKFLNEGFHLQVEVPSVLICQQALRCYMDIAHNNTDERRKSYQHLRDILESISIETFERHLTEFMLIAPTHP